MNINLLWINGGNIYSQITISLILKLFFIDSRFGKFILREYLVDHRYKRICMLRFYKLSDFILENQIRHKNRYQNVYIITWQIHRITYLKAHSVSLVKQVGDLLWNGGADERWFITSKRFVTIKSWVHENKFLKITDYCLQQGLCVFF